MSDLNPKNTSGQTMSVVEWRKLGEALESDDMGMNDPVVLAAARLTYDRYQECDGRNCMNGRVPTRVIQGYTCNCHTGRGETECLAHTDWEDCPSCGGSGLLDLFHEVAHRAWHLMDDSGETDDPGLYVHSGQDHQKLSMALDALEASGWAAVRAFDKEEKP